MKIDLGCGPTYREGFIRIDNNPVHKPDVLMDMRVYVKSLETDSVKEAICSHAIEFLSGWEIYEFMNELHRVIKEDGTLRISVTSVILPTGQINPKAWTVPLLKTHFSPATFDTFQGGATLKYRGVKPWEISEYALTDTGELTVYMYPIAKDYINHELDTVVTSCLKEKRKQLEHGVSVREEALQHSGTTKAQAAAIRTQLKNWKQELEDLKNGAYQKHLALTHAPLVGDWASDRVDIICLKYKEEDIEKKCASHLIDHTKWPHKLTWYDARNQTANFSKLWNHLVCISTCDYIVIMDSDAFVSENWLTKMMACFSPEFECLASKDASHMVHPKNVGVVVPRTREGAASTVQGHLGEHSNPTPFLTDAQVSGFFFLFKKEVWNDIGAFDERFYLHGQDSEWIDRVIASKWDIVVCPDVFVDHLVSSSITKAAANGEVNYGVDISYTKIVYDLIRAEKKQGVYAPFRY